MDPDAILKNSRTPPRVSSATKPRKIAGWLKTTAAITTPHSATVLPSREKNVRSLDEDGAAAGSGGDSGIGRDYQGGASPRASAESGGRCAAR
ncbi:MAG: hypothetical protein R3F11_31340 [Verrucomicrobiales bacterium]